MNGKRQKMVIPHLGILVTSYCNLNCRRCADLIPKRRNVHYRLEDVKQDMEKVLAAVSYIEEVLVIGGETLLYPWLEEVLDFCGNQEKVGKLIITTNGSISPTEEVLECLKREEVLVRVSGYPEYVVPNRREIIERYITSGVRIENLENMQWADIGEPYKRKRPVSELKKVFRTCSMRDCVAMQHEGKIFYCSRSASAYETEIYPFPLEAEFIDVRKEKKLSQKIREFYALPYISTCDYCDGISCATEQTALAAIQMLDKDIFLELLGRYCAWKDGEAPWEETVLAIKDLFVENKERLYDMYEYGVCIAALEAWTRTGSKESVEIFMETVRKLINVLTKDYTYQVNSNIPFARQRGERKPRNTITVGNAKDEGQEDLLVGEEELFREVGKVYLLDNTMYNRLFIESRMERLKKEKVECIVCGLSYTQYGFIEKDMSVNTLNLSVTGQDISYSVLMAEKVLEINNGINSVIIPFTYYQGFYDMSGDDRLIHKDVVSRIDIPLLQKERNYHGEVIWKGYLKQEPSLAIYDEICDMECYVQMRDVKLRSELQTQEYFNEKYPYPRFGGLKFDFKKLKQEEKWEAAKKTAELNERVCTCEGYAEVCCDLERFLGKMEKSGKRVIFFVPPMTRYLFAAYDKKLRQEFYEKIIDKFEKYKNVTFMDLACDERFDDEDFCDFEHLGQLGAVKLTKILNSCVINGN
ncbi:MAG: D-alanyl-lipoteichoic acid biosynthesis protein DltD [Clostridiales bacterium]|nr:hypothetical protein [Roseburia sp.]MDD7637172.1 D-alanyl-lipoteichoic acid biosynthesis protein DltD [Clostridiales bacterium]